MKNYTEEEKSSVISMLSAGASITSIHDETKIPKATLYRWRAETKQPTVTIEDFRELQLRVKVLEDYIAKQRRTAEKAAEQEDYENERPVGFVLKRKN